MTGPPDPPELDSDDERLARALDTLARVQMELDRERLARAEIEATFDRMITSMTDALVLVDPRGDVVRVNDAAAELLGVVPEDVVGSPFGAVAPGDVPATPWELFQRSPVGQVEVETSVPDAHGHERELSVSCAVVRDRPGKVVGAVYVARDLTEVQRLLAAVSAAEQQWRLVADVSRLLSENIDPRATLDDVLAHVAEVAGTGVAAVLTREVVIDEVRVADGGQSCAAELRAALAAGEPLPEGTALAAAVREHRTLHHRTSRPDFPLWSAGGAGGPQSVALVPLLARGEAQGALLLFSDEPGGVSDEAVRVADQVVDRIAVAISNSRLRDSLAQLRDGEAAARSRDDLLAGLSHDMKNPLAVLGPTLQLLVRHGDEMPSEDRAQLYRSMFRQTQQLRRLVLQFLDYVRLEAGERIVSTSEAVDVPAVVQGVLDTVHAPNPVVVDHEPDLPLARADRERLDQVLANLLSNAVKFSSPDAEIRITTRTVGRTVEISVIDRGVGISAADQARLFERFHRSAGAAGTAGTGLGLYMSRLLVEAQGGHITVSSRPGEGSRFSVVLPVA